MHILRCYNEYLLVSVGCADELSVTACSSDVAASLVNDFGCILDVRVFWYCFYSHDIIMYNYKDALIIIGDIPSPQ